jgi:hypothetical protein
MRSIRQSGNIPQKINQNGRKRIQQIHCDDGGCLGLGAGDWCRRQLEMMNISMQGVFDWNATTGEVRKDIATAQAAR